jgi:hypothetical protein
MTLPVAHAGHWLVNLLYIAPVLFIFGVIAREKWRERREARGK